MIVKFDDADGGRPQWSNGAAAGLPPEAVSTLGAALAVIKAAEEESDLMSMTWLDYQSSENGSRSIRLDDGRRLKFILDGDVVTKMSIEVDR